MKHRPRRRAFSILEVMTYLVIVSFLMNSIFVLYLRADRANTVSWRAMERLLYARRTLDDLPAAVRAAKAVLPAHGPWKSDARTLILKDREDRIRVFTLRDGGLAEIDPGREDGLALVRPIGAAEVRFDYLPGPPAPAGGATGVTCTFVLEAVWGEPSDRLVLTTSAALRAPEEEARP